MYDRIDDIKDILKLRKVEVKSEYDTHDGKDAFGIGKLRGKLDALSFSLVVVGKESPEELRATFPEYMAIIDEGRAKHKKQIKDKEMAEWYLEHLRDITVAGEFTPAARFVELHPPYPGAVWTDWRREAYICNPSVGDASVGQESVSHMMHTYYEYTSPEASLQSKLVALLWTIPDDFAEWTEFNAVTVRFRTESGTYLNSHVDVAIYKDGISLDVTSYGDHVSTDWAVVSHSRGHLGSWKPGDVMEIYLKLASRNDYYARVGSIRFNYVAK